MVGPLEQRAKLADVPDLLQLEHAIDNAGGLRRAKHRRHEVVAFGHELSARHRILNGAAHVQVHCVTTMNHEARIGP